MLWAHASHRLPPGYAALQRCYANLCRAMRGQGNIAMPMRGQGNKTICFLKQTVLLVRKQIVLLVESK